MTKKYFVAGIGTEVGKTLVSSVLVHKLKADYWKPIQCGDLDKSDSISVSRLCPDAHIFKETYALKEPASPHYAAALEETEIQLERFKTPETKNPLIIEGAGGLLVPLNSQHTLLDLMVKLGMPVILVSRNYLGSINHTLLSIAQLKARGLTLEGVVFNGDENKATQEVIERMTGVNILGRVENLTAINQHSIAQQAHNLKEI
mgnify:CR=1 FL=1